MGLPMSVIGAAAPRHSPPIGAACKEKRTDARRSRCAAALACTEPCTKCSRNRCHEQIAHQRMDCCRIDDHAERLRRCPWAALCGFSGALPVLRGKPLSTACTTRRGRGYRALPRLFLDHRLLGLGQRPILLASRALGSAASRLQLGSASVGTAQWSLAGPTRPLGTPPLKNSRCP